ncbi:hypothetical protein CDD83_9733 [Cordyceps sp. RAO-2017]|nr:hypothetical protein CDD83_9733 [Cordyceps sp. RAO-2017]
MQAVSWSVWRPRSGAERTQVRDTDGGTASTDPRTSLRSLIVAEERKKGGRGEVVERRGRGLSEVTWPVYGNLSGRPQQRTTSLYPRRRRDFSGQQGRAIDGHDGPDDLGLFNTSGIKASSVLRDRASLLREGLVGDDIFLGPRIPTKAWMQTAREESPSDNASLPRVFNDREKRSDEVQVASSSGSATELLGEEQAGTFGLVRSQASTHSRPEHALVSQTGQTPWTIDPVLPASPKGEGRGRAKRAAGPDGGKRMMPRMG